MEITIGIKLPKGDVSAKACMAIKKLTGLSLAEIKQKAAEDEYLVEFPIADDDGLKLINKLKRELKKHGVKARLFEGGREEDPELFDNLEELHRSINKEYGAYDDEL